MQNVALENGMPVLLAVRLLMNVMPIAIQRYGDVKIAALVLVQ